MTGFIPFGFFFFVFYLVDENRLIVLSFYPCAHVVYTDIRVGTYRVVELKYVINYG